MVGLFLLLLAFNGLNVVNSYVGRDFMTAIADRRHRQYAFYAALYAGVFAVSAVDLGLQPLRRGAAPAPLASGRPAG